MHMLRNMRTGFYSHNIGEMRADRLVNVVPRSGILMKNRIIARHSKNEQVIMRQRGGKTFRKAKEPKRKDVTDDLGKFFGEYYA